MLQFDLQDSSRHITVLRPVKDIIGAFMARSGFKDWKTWKTSISHVCTVKSPVLATVRFFGLKTMHGSSDFPCQPVRDETEDCARQKAACYRF